MAIAYPKFIRINVKDPSTLESKGEIKTHSDTPTIIRVAGWALMLMLEA